MTRLPELGRIEPHQDLLPLRLAAIEALIAAIDAPLSAGPITTPSRLEDLSLQHLAKATGTARSALLLMRERCWTDAGILIRAVIEQLFAYLWVVADPAKADSRGAMVTLKQEWANAKYLEGLAVRAAPEAQRALLDEAARYRRVAESMLTALAAELGTTEKKVRDEATLRVSAKAVEVNIGPEFSIPYAHYSGFVHSDGNALAAYGRPTAEGVAYDTRGAAPRHVPLAGDLHRALLRVTQEVLARCPSRLGPALAPTVQAHADWLAEADALERQRAHSA